MRVGSHHGSVCGAANSRPGEGAGAWGGQVQDMPILQLLCPRTFGLPHGHQLAALTCRCEGMKGGRTNRWGGVAATDAAAAGGGARRDEP